MQNRSIIMEELAKFGLSPIDATIYLLLTEHGELRIQSITNLAKVPRTSVYESLKTLLNLGLVEKTIDQKFTKIRAYPVGNLKHHLDEQMGVLQKLQLDLTSLEKTISLSRIMHDHPTVIRYYTGVSGARQLFYNSLQAKGPLFVYSAYSGRSKHLGTKFYTNFVRESQEKKLLENVLVNPTSETLDLIRSHTGSTLSRTSVDHIRYQPENTLLIRRESFIYNNIYAEVDLSSEEMNGFEIENENFVRMQQSIFKTLWESAKPIAQLL